MLKHRWWLMRFSWNQSIEFEPVALRYWQDTSIREETLAYHVCGPQNKTMHTKESSIQKKLNIIKKYILFFIWKLIKIEHIL
jgi:beta-xylosidase